MNFNINKMMKQAQEMQDKLKSIQDTIGQKHFKGISGGGMVEVTLSGKHELVAIHLDPSIINPDDRELIEDLIRAAHADALKRVQEDSESAMQSALGGLSLPPGFKMPF
jgi:DNA-binding YbaB/EbfC family protein